MLQIKWLPGSIHINRGNTEMCWHTFYSKKYVGVNGTGDIGLYKITIGNFVHSESIIH